MLNVSQKGLKCNLSPWMYFYKIRERQKKAKLLIWHFSHVKQDAVYTKYERKNRNSRDSCTVGPILTSREATQPFTSEDPLHC